MLGRFVVVLVAAACFVGCMGESGGGSGGDEDDYASPRADLQYIGMRIRCGVPAVGAQVVVEVYDESNGVRVVRGNSVERPPFNGAFVSLIRFDVSRTYQIQFREIGSDECFFWVRNVSESGNSAFFRDDNRVTDDLPTVSIGASCSDFRPVSGCFDTD